MRTGAAVAILLAVALAGGCASIDGRSVRGALPASAAECLAWYRALDAEVDATGVRDAQYTRIDGFPYLRVDRFLASRRALAAAYPSALEAWWDRLSQLDLESRRHEIANLPRSIVEALPGMTDAPRAAALRRSEDCSRALRAADAADPKTAAALLATASVPDDYSDAARAAGVYPLTRRFFYRGVERWQDETAAAFQREPGMAPGSSLVRFSPPSATIPHAVAAGMLGRASLDPLGMPILTPRELGLLAAAYAPIFEIVIAADYDRFGELRWRRDGTVPEVNASSAVVYANSAYTRYGDHVLLQLVYTIWFPERPPQGTVDVLAGRLDGVVWRVTLAPDGQPLVYDSMHACGCYHQFFPTPRARVRPAPGGVEWAFVPRQLGLAADGSRPVVRLASATHYIEQVSMMSGESSLARYAIEPYDELRSMQSMDGGSRSAFGPDGIVAGTERAERWFFWPMGIASAGAMRQWGRHATAFVGRRHFDDADLLELRFELDLAERAP